MCHLKYLDTCDSSVIEHYLTTQKEVVMVESSTVRPLMALLTSILDVMASPHRINKWATFSAIHSSGESSNVKAKDSS